MDSVDDRYSTIDVGRHWTLIPGRASALIDTPPSSEELARAYKPYIETCIAAFGPDRGMFESNFPPDGFSSSYAVLWNALKRLAAGYSTDEKAKLFSGTAKRVYRLA